jgi:hypothetical protein
MDGLRNDDDVLTHLHERADVFPLLLPFPWRRKHVSLWFNMGDIFTGKCVSKTSDFTEEYVGSDRTRERAAEAKND